ncbi:MAG: transcriptional repressor general negative regulator of transcription subunit 4 [Piccolia ochrophora]|nr:MAG: transcriptional repressor general negative regulator of transcription subunit 4 [Piccolia ochrophora]
MAGRVQQDSFIDDSDESCPLCVEEFDISDRNFKPCPCGYQVCQFCYNNIKNNMNGLCPACRRPYDDQTIEWKVISPEEFKADLQKQARKKADIRQKEAQKREVESLNRKHLSGLRVVQKNLVYVTGLTPRIREEDLLHTLRGDQYFGQYGKIVKIVVSKSKDPGLGNQPLGVYVTFARKQDAETCIAAVDGSDNGGRTLRAQFGTTKYCSAYLRNEPCTNKNCMFLHEPGEEKDSFTRQDLSSINVVSTQRPAQTSAGPSSSHTQPPQPQPPVQQSSHGGGPAAESMIRDASKEGATSPTESNDSSALPSTASWATKGQQQRSRRTSQAASTSTSSPQAGSVAVASQSRHGSRSEGTSGAALMPQEQQTTDQVRATPENRGAPSPLLHDCLKSITSPQFKFIFAKSMFTPDEYDAIANHPPLFDPHGGAKRRAIREAEEKDRLKDDEQAQKVVQTATETQPDEVHASGSLQLGGEPEDRSENREPEGPRDPFRSSLPERLRATNQPPQQSLNVNALQGPNFAQNYRQNGALSNLAINGRGLTPSQQQHLLLLKSNSPQSSTFGDQLPQSLNQNQHQQSTAFQNQAQQQLSQGHGRQTSRYTFGNDPQSTSNYIKPAANATLMAQQSSMMPSGASNQGPAAQNQQHQQQQHQAGGQFYGNSMQGPPPGLKSAGTPPMSGGGMFSQGHGFASGLGGGLGLGGNNETKSEQYREALRTRGTAGGGGMSQALDSGKRESMFPSFLQQYPTSSTPAPVPGHLGSLYGPQPGAFQDYGLQKQKKKGKKHRHANTSSFGGGGVVDLADPSILQARMQQQSGTSAGQGLFNGQGQGGYNPANMMYGGSFGRW